MKLLPWVLVGSLAVNAALVGMVVKGSVAARQREKVTEAALAATIEANAKATSPAVPVLAPEIITSAKAFFTDPKYPLTAADLKSFADQLRAAGFPASTVRAMITGLVQDRMMGRYREMQAAMGQRKYWSNQSMYSGMMSKEMMAKNRAIGDERQQLLKAALGEDALQSEFLSFGMQSQYGNLAPAKAERLQRITQDYSELRNEIQATAQGILLPEDREKLALLEKEQRTDLEELLTPDEQFEYEVRSSPASYMLRSRLGTFNATEDEFRALYKQVRESSGAGSLGQAYTAEDHNKFQAGTQAAAKAVLTPERYAEFQPAADPQYLQINRLVLRLNLPPAAAKEVVAIRQDTMKQAGSLRTNTALTPEQRTAQLTTLTQAATQKLSTTLGGDRGLEAYRQNGGQWLQQIPQMAAPRPAGNVGDTVPAVFLPGGGK